MLGKISADDILKYFFLFFLENRIWHFIQIVSKSCSSPMLHWYNIMFVPNIFKSPQTIWELFSASGDMSMYIKKKWELSLLHVTCQQELIKYYQNISNWPTKEFGLEICSGAIPEDQIKSFLHVILLPTQDEVDDVDRYMIPICLPCYNSVCTNCQAAYVMKRKNQYLKIAHAVTWRFSDTQPIHTMAASLIFSFHKTLIYFSYFVFR